LNTFFKEITLDRPQEIRAAGVVLRDPSAWYFKKNSFITKKASDKTTVMRVAQGQFKWFVISFFISDHSGRLER
jgi:hypothetical protein